MEATVMETKVPNLDAETEADLWLFYARHQHGRAYTKLFPAGGKGTVNATKLLADYAAHRAEAINYRINGRVAAAMRRELECDAIYADLPDWARW